MSKNFTCPLDFVAHVTRCTENLQVRTSATVPLTLGRLLASGRAGHESVPRYERPRGRKTCKIARQPACKQNDFVGGWRYFAFRHKRTSFVKCTVVKCQNRRELSHEQNHFVRERQSVVCCLYAENWQTIPTVIFFILVIPLLKTKI
jgi:hypothetical protein